MPLSQLLVPFLKLSNNMHAEALTKTMGTLTGRRAAGRDGLAYTTAYLQQLGVPMTGVAAHRRLRADPAEPASPRSRLATTLQKVRRRSLVAGLRRRAAGGREHQRT